jgi:hypothetical protein
MAAKKDSTLPAGASNSVAGGLTGEVGDFRGGYFLGEFLRGFKIFLYLFNGFCTLRNERIQYIYVPTCLENAVVGRSSSSA